MKLLYYYYILLLNYCYYIKISLTIEQTSLEVINETNEDIDVYWVDISNPSKTSLLLLSTLSSYSQQNFFSYYSHQFVFTYSQNNPPRGRISFTKSDDDEIIIISSNEKNELIYERELPAEIVKSTPPRNENKNYRDKRKIENEFYGERTRSNVKKEAEKIQLSIQNSCPYVVEIFWIDPNGELIEMGDNISQTKQSSFDSYENHNFLFRFQANSDQLINKEIKFTKSFYEEKVELFCNQETKEVEIFITSPYDKIYSSIETALEDCSQYTSIIDSTSFDSTKLADCLTPHLFDDYSETLESGQVTRQYRDQLTERLRNYTCDDDTLQTTEPIETKTEIVLDKEYQVDSHLLRDEAQIFVVHNFITDNECDILKKSAEPRLERAVVVGADGGAEVSENRRAQQASYNLKSPKDPLWNLYYRILNFTNSHTNYNLKPAGQEYFTVIQYNKTDEYTPHCDGSCDGEPHISTGRVATAVLYCEVPEVGGATTFTKADVFIRPKKGMATFFTYMSPDGIMDSGYTEHSGCPVKVGQKWIATAWMREGVTEEFNSEKFEPSGKRIFDKRSSYDQVVEFEQDGLF